ncbi:MAG: MFS transporter [Tepidiforma sp.]|uniref:MFS transporter n=1 Tax=Tepidiforma sp. TaxID=2682230 RepID=UPI0021DE89E3|nr:MFS transporter [Tepidiforma sp.]GIW16202.1 MAG: MFS transporter [Tepidiforma sp.]
MNGNVSPAPFRIRSLTVPVYLPTFLFAVGQGAVIPVMPLYAIEVGASPAFAGFLVALRGIGTMAFDIPAGMMVSRLGERWAMLAATAVLFLVAIGFALVPSPLILAPLAFLMGCTWAVWMLARLSYATDVAPLDQRGRVLSLIGGSNRIGNFAGPFLGAAGASLLGTDAAFYLQALLALAAAILIFAVVRETPADHGAAGAGHPVLGVLRQHAAVFATAGLASLAIQVLRSSRQAVIPLWGDRIGLDAAQVSVIFGLSSALDMTLFYPVGIVMDRWGRKFAGVPCLLFMSAGMLLVPLSESYLALLLASLLISFGNGLGSGINMTLGSDFSPAVGRGEFLGAWRLVTDLGTAGGPLLVSAIIGVSSLAAAAVATGGIGLAGAAVLAFLVPEPLRRHRPAAGPAPGA